MRAANDVRMNRACGSIALPVGALLVGLSVLSMSCSTENDGSNQKPGGTAGNKASGGAAGSSSGGSGGGGAAGKGGAAGNAQGGGGGGGSAGASGDAAVDANTGIDGATSGIEAGPPDGGSAVPPVPPRKFYWSVAMADNFLKQWPNMWNWPIYQQWSYCHGYVLYGFEMLYRYTNDKKYSDYMKNYIDHYVNDQGKLSAGLGTLDNILTGTSIVQVYEIYGGQKYQTAAARVRAEFNVDFAPADIGQARAAFA